MAEIKTVRLNRSDSQPWGFRLQGGRDYGVDLSVLKVICGSIAERAGLMAGDLICKINNIDVFHMTHKEAQDLIVRSGNNIDIQIQRGPTTLWRPTVTPTGPLPTSVGNNSGLVTRTSLAHKPQVVSHIGCGYNNAARPFVNGRDGQLKSIMNAQHNTPIGLYSDESIAETLSAQAEVLAGGVLGVNFKKNEKVYNAANSEVYKFLQEQEHDPHEPEPQAPQNFFWTASHAIGGRRSPLPLYNAATVDVSKTQHQQQYHHEKSSITSSSAATTEIENSTSVIKHDERIGTSLQQNTLAPEAPHRPSLPTSAATSTSTNQSYKDYQELEKYKDSSSSVMFGSGACAGGSVPTCDGCGVSIVGVFVRIKDKNLHVDCFKCATCGTSLKNQGYFNLNNKLYCDIHAKLAAMQNPPAGTEGYLPVPIKPGTKLSASTISAALSAHHLHQANGGTTHLITSPTSNTTNYSSPKPFGPPVSSQKSPTSYPPQHQQQQQQQQYQQTNWSQQSSKPATNPYATLPRSTGPTQGRFNTYKPGIINNFNRECLEQTKEYSSVRENQYHQQQQREEHHYEDIEVETATRGQISSFIWPPLVDEDRCTPTASPLYIAPPETQKVVPKPIQRKDQQQIQQQQQQQILEQQQYLQMQSTQEQYQNQIEQQQQQQQQQHWQSRSAPELTAGRQLELESGSDSYTSTCTTTTTTSEEYQKMYQAQMQAYQMQQMYDQSGSEIDYHMDMEVAAMQQQQQHEQSYSNLSFLSTQSGRRSVQECAELISGPVSTYKLVDLVREVTPSPEVPVHKGPRRVEFADEQSKEISSCQQSESIKCQETKKLNTEIKSKMEKEEQIVKEVKEVTENKCQIEQRKFQPTPEIKIEIPEPKPIPPTNIPNPVPKEWISPMVKALTTAPDKPVEISEVRHCESPCGAEECEAICMKSKKTLIEKTNTKADNKEKRIEPEVLKESPPEGSFITKVMTTAPDEKVKFTPKSSDIISLPEETEPYMPPPIDKKPYIREDYRPKSPLLSALTTAPETPYSPFGHDVMSQLNDLPTPKSKLTMKDALTVAPERCYTPLSSENTLNIQLDENKQNKLFSEHKMKTETAQKSKQNIDTHMNQQISAFKSTQDSKVQLNQVPSISQNSLTVDSSLNQESQFLAHRDSFAMNNARQSAFTYHVSQQQQRQQETYQASSVQSSSYKCMNQSQMQSKTHHTCSSTTAAKQISCLKSECQQKSQDAEQKVVFPPPSPIPTPTSKKAIVSGLHKPDTIPQYQRNWTVLPSQRPVRTPEPQELKENVPLAFVEVPKERSPSVQRQINPETTKNSTSSDTKRTSNETKPQSSVPIIIEDRSGPITMTFQSIDDQKEDRSQAHPRPFTPSLINKPAPIIPFYQTPQKLVFEECQPAKAQPFDRRSASPLPDRAKSPAPGPPPNPLSAIRAPRIREEDSAGYRNLQVGSITTGQSYYASQAMQKQQQQQGQMTSHYQTTSAYGSQKFIDKPEIVQQKKIGDTTIQTREKESRLDEEQRRELQSKTTTQIGNTQIERRRKVVEEYEHTQSAKTIEIQKSSGSTVQQTRQQYGKTGFVANQARRLSNLEQEISNISSQSQAISARAANLGSESPSRFPFFKSPEPVSKFPIKPDVSPYDESRDQAYVVSADTSRKLLDPPPGFQKQQSHKQKQATISSQYSSYDASSVAQSSSATQSLLAASSNQSSLSSASNLTNAIPVPAFKPPVGGNSDTLCGKSSLQQPTSNNNTYKPTPSTGPAGFKPPQQPAPQISSNTNPSVVVSDPSPASAGSNKGGAFGATSAPKRGRGILNKAVGPGVRIPHCGCCNTQIRGPFITALGRIWCPDHFVCVNANCRRALQDIGFVEEKGDLYCEYCFEKYLAPTCSKCNAKIKGDCLNAIGKHFHPECFTCAYCGKIFGNTPFFMEEGEPYCEADWNELFTTKCFACGFPVEAGDRWVEALNHNYHSQCFNCTLCKKNLEGQSFYNKGGRPFCKNHAR